MKIVTASNGKKTLKISEKEWLAIGAKAGWKVAQTLPLGLRRYRITDVSGPNPGQTFDQVASSPEKAWDKFSTQKFGVMKPDKKSYNIVVLQQNETQQKTAQSESSLVTKIRKLFEKEINFRQVTQDIPEMEELATEERSELSEGFDGDFGAGTAISAKDYVESLEEPYVDVFYDGNEMFNVTFYGNYEPSSVNAGTARKIRIGFYTRKDILALVKAAKMEKWPYPIQLGDKAKMVLKMF